MSDKVAVMFDGEVEQVDSPRELYERPASQRVASFIGDMNFINEKALETKDGLKVNSEILGNIVIPKNQVSGNLLNNKIIIGIRPEMISIITKNSDSKGLISGKITDISYFGITTYYKIECGSNAKALSVLAQNSFGQMDYKIGETVKLKMDVNSLVRFLE